MCLYYWSSTPVLSSEHYSEAATGAMKSAGKTFLRKENVGTKTLYGLFLLIWLPASYIAQDKILMNQARVQQNQELINECKTKSWG